MLRDRRVLESEWYATDVITLTLMLKTGDNLNAITAFDAALSVNQTDTHALDNLAAIFNTLGDRIQASKKKSRYSTPN